MASASNQGIPAAEVDIDVDLVRGLLRDQHADLGDLEITEFANGWDNVMFRLGDELLVRLPRRELAAPLIEHEQRWLPELAGRLPLPIPAPLRVGGPGRGFPWPWSVLRWIPGTAVGNAGWGQPDEAAEAIGHFLAALHWPAPNNAPTNQWRGGPLAGRHDITLGRIEELADQIDAPAAVAAWTASVEAAPYDGPPLWLHGDLHPFNLIQHEGRPSAVIDFGDISSGDPACDLAVAFAAFDAGQRARLRKAADSSERPIDDAMWLRARGWCLSIGAAVLASSADKPEYRDLGQRMIAAGCEPLD